MNIKPKMSVIIPVYNVEKWLNKCIDSILEQTYENIEVILIDDGSTDNSSKICDYYLEKSDKIKVFHNDNKGLSYSRNFGLKNSNGEYVVFVDSDDFISDKYIIEKFVDILENESSDFIYTSYCNFNDGNEENITKQLPINIYINSIKDTKGIDLLALLIKKNSYHHSACIKICRRDFLVNNNLFFKECIYHEDVEWTAKLFYYARRVSIYKEAYYMRRVRENSITTSCDEKIITKRICDRLNIANELLYLFQSLENSEERDVIIVDLVRMYWGDLMCVSKVNLKENICKCLYTINNTKRVLTFCNNKKYRIAKYIINIFGSSNFIKLLKGLFKWKSFINNRI